MKFSVNSKITFKEILYIFIPQQFMQNWRTPGSPSGKWFRYKSVSTTPGFTQHTSTSEWSRILSTQYICIIYNSNCHYVHCKFRHVFTLWSKIVKPQTHIYMYLLNLIYEINSKVMRMSISFCKCAIRFSRISHMKLTKRYWIKRVMWLPSTFS